MPQPEAEHLDPTAAELEQARAERDAAVQQLGRLEDERRKTRRHTGRRVLSAVLVILFVILLPLTVAAGWAHRTVLDTDTYVATVTPIAADPAVISAVSRDITDQLYAALDPQAAIAGALPPKAAFLAGPIANAARSQVQDAVDKVLSSDQFQQLWEDANRFAHTELVTVLRGDSSVLQTTQGQVVLNLVPILRAALQNASAFVSGVIGRAVTLPEITSEEAPSAACEKISVALARPLPATCGQIALFPSKNLETAQRAVRAFDRLVVALLIVVPLLFAAAIWASPRRRRTLLQLTVGGMVGIVVVRRLLFWEQGRLIDSGRPGNEDARRAITHGVLDGFFDLSLWLLVGGLVLVVLAAVTGPYRWAVATRGGLAKAGSTTVALGRRAFGDTASTGDPQSDKAVGWVRAHFDLLRITGAVVAAVLLLALDVGFWGFVVVAGLLVLYEVSLHRLRPPAVVMLPPEQPAGTAG